jgi:predicted amidohydrolase
MSTLELMNIETWAPHPKAAPLTERSGETFAIAANGTRTCVGGWQLSYSGAVPGTAYAIRVKVRFSDVDEWRDRLQCVAYWGDIPADERRRRNGDVVEWDYLLPEPDGDEDVTFGRIFTAPEGTDRLNVRFTFRWTTEGSSDWTLPEIEVVEAESWPAASTIVVATGRRDAFKGVKRTIEGNLDYYAALCEKACEQATPDLVLLPEIAVQYGVNGSPIDLAVPVPGPESERFAEIARSRGVRILLGIIEREEDAVYNSAVLIGPDGGIEGTYRKVHLAVGGEMDSGILPGESFPVFETEMGRIGCNICMDSSAAESSRMIGLNGADFLLLPIMGDHRAWHPENHTWDAERFRGIMQTRALDNQLCIVVAVNRGEGSCIIDRTGHVLAWNDGTEDVIAATVDLDDGFRPSSKGCYRGVNWMQRRPHVYGAFVDRENMGSLT